MKSEIRFLGIDDAPFSFGQKTSFLIGVVMRASGYIEAVLKKDIAVDGIDATNACIDIVLSTRQKDQLKAVLLDGVTVAGFNVLNLHRIYETTNIPLLTITRDKPDFSAIEKALQAHFSDWKTRFALIEEEKLHQIKTAHNDIFISCIGLSIEEAKEIITLSTIRGVIPEPIRIAHLIASGVRRGESHGKA